MDITVALGILAGLVATVVTAVVNNPTWSPQRKRVVSLVVSTFWAIIAALGSGVIVGVPSEVTDWVVRIIVMIAGVVVSAQGIYSQFKDILKTIEVKTSPSDAPSGELPTQ